MKNMINYYYGLNVDEISYSDNKYYINTNGGKYILKEINESKENINLNLIKELEKNDNYFKIIRNINNEILTLINRKKYILLKVGNKENRKINLYDINYMVSMNSNIFVKDWIGFWEQKVDIYERIISDKKQMIGKNLGIFQYYIGLSENAIMYIKKIMKTVKAEEFQIIPAHSRINPETTLYNFNDPTNILLDHISRDISEYVKSQILNDSFNIEYFITYLENIKISKAEINLFFARMMFPTFYFDTLEKNEEVDKYEYIISKYEYQLKEINKVLNEKYGIEIVKWLFK